MAERDFMELKEGDAKKTWFVFFLFRKTLRYSYKRWGNRKHSKLVGHDISRALFVKLKVLKGHFMKQNGHFFVIIAKSGELMSPNSYFYAKMCKQSFL